MPPECGSSSSVRRTPSYISRTMKLIRQSIASQHPPYFPDAARYIMQAYKGHRQRIAARCLSTLNEEQSSISCFTYRAKPPCSEQVPSVLLTETPSQRFCNTPTICDPITASFRSSMRLNFLPPPDVVFARHEQSRHPGTGAPGQVKVYLSRIPHDSEQVDE